MTIRRKLVSSADLRKQADICRGLASVALTERNRLFWLRLADEWAELATRVYRTDDALAGGAGMRRAAAEAGPH
jgi:hypothetical protein